MCKQNIYDLLNYWTVFAEIQIIDEYKNVTNSPPTSNDTTEDQTKLSSEEINEKMCLVHREKIQGNME